MTTAPPAEPSAFASAAGGPPGAPQVVIAHDYLTQKGGAERVVLAMARAFPDARIVTSVYDAESTFAEFKSLDVRSTWLSRVPHFRADPRRALPLLAPVWSRIRVDADVVLCSSTGWAHGVSTDAPKVVYCHNPARWLYQGEEYLTGAGRVARSGMALLGRALRTWDRRAASSATRYLANSSIVAGRVRDTYGIEADIVHPPVVDGDGPLEPVAGIEPGFLLTVGRSRGYKNTDAVIAAVEGLPDERLVVVGDDEAGNSPRITGLTGVSDAQLRWLYSNADALVACAYEDFGLTPIEAYRAGTPAVVLEAGGYLDTTVPGITGEFIASPDPADISHGIRRLRDGDYSEAAIREHSDSFSLDSFSETLRGIVLEEHERASRTA